MPPLSRARVDDAVTLMLRVMREFSDAMMMMMILRIRDIIIARYCFCYAMPDARCADAPLFSADAGWSYVACFLRLLPPRYAI